MLWFLVDTENCFQKYVMVLTKINKSNLSHTFDMYRHSFRKCGVKLFEFLRSVKLLGTHMTFLHKRLILMIISCDYRFYYE